jgi:hypothetical protein
VTIPTEVAIAGGIAGAIAAGGGAAANITATSTDIRGTINITGALALTNTITVTFQSAYPSAPFVMLSAPTLAVILGTATVTTTATTLVITGGVTTTGSFNYFLIG